MAIKTKDSKEDLKEKKLGMDIIDNMGYQAQKEKNMEMAGSVVDLSKYNKWKSLYESGGNMRKAGLNITKKELELFRERPDIEFYVNILTFVERVYNEHEELEHLEKLVYNDGGEGTRMLYKTTMIRIAAEYEMYHTIFGIPDSGEYNQGILGKIRSLMETDGITYKEIKSEIENEFK